MSEATFAYWEVTRAKNAGQKPNPHGGQLDKWYCGFKNLDGGTDCDDAYWQRKNPSEVTVGDKVYGKIEKGEYGFRFFLEPEPDGATQSSGGSTEARTGSKPRDLDHSIARQVALKVLSESINAAADETGQALPQRLRIGVEEVEAFILEAGQASSQASDTPPAQVGAPTSSGAPPASDSMPADDNAQFFSQLMEAAGENQVAAHALGLFVAEKFNPEQKQRAEDQLKDEVEKLGCLARLRTTYETTTGKLVPSPGDDDIPF